MNSGTGEIIAAHSGTMSAECGLSASLSAQWTGLSGDSMRSCCTSCILAALLVSPAISRGASAEIKSNYDEKQRLLTWQIKNIGASPIVEVEIPHFHAVSCTPPDGWTVKSTNLEGTEAPSEGGVCKLKASQEAMAILPGGSKTVLMKLGAADSDVVEGEVKIQLAGGTSENIPGVEISYKPHRGFGPLPTIVLAGLLGLYIVWRARRGRALPAQQPDPGDEAI